MSVVVPVLVGLTALVATIVKMTLVFSKLQSSIEGLSRLIETIHSNQQDLDGRVKSLEMAEVIRTAKEAATDAATNGHNHTNESH